MSAADYEVERVDAVSASVTAVRAGRPSQGYAGLVSVAVAPARRGVKLVSLLVVDPSGAAHVARISPERMKRLVDALVLASADAWGRDWATAPVGVSTRRPRGVPKRRDVDDDFTDFADDDADEIDFGIDADEGETDEGAR
jgi:hypothetical protein